MSFLKKFLILNVVSLLSVTAGQAAPINLQPVAKESQNIENNWKEFTSQENGFTIELPRIPDHIHQKIDVPKSTIKLEYDTYVSEPSDSAVYVISVWDYPPEIDMSRPEINLQDGFGGMLAALPNAQVLSMKMTDVQGFKALDFHVKSDDLYFQGKLILVYNTLYQVFAVYKDKEKMADNYTRFIDSFKLVKPESRKVEAPKGKAKEGIKSSSSSKKLSV